MVRDDMDAKELLAELEDIGATGDKEVAREDRRKEFLEFSKKLGDLPTSMLAVASLEYPPPPEPVPLDERADKMVQLADIVITELDGLINSAVGMRNALLEMRELWNPLTEESPEGEDTE